MGMRRDQLLPRSTSMANRYSAHWRADRRRSQLLGGDEPDDGRTWMPTSLEDCDCNKICPESTDCTCIWFASTSVCECDCSGPIVIGPTLLAGGPNRDQLQGENTG